MNRERIFMMEYMLIVLAYVYLLDANVEMAVGLSLAAAVGSVVSHSVRVFRRCYFRIICLYIAVMGLVSLTSLPLLLNGLSGVLLGQSIFTGMWMEDSGKLMRPIVYKLELLFLSMTALLLAVTPYLLDWFYVTDLKTFGGYVSFLVLTFLFVPAAFRGKQIAAYAHRCSGNFQKVQIRFADFSHKLTKLEKD